MERLDGPLPDPVQLANALDALFRGGGKLFNEPPQEEPADNSAAEAYERSIIENFIYVYFPQIPMGDIRVEAQKLLQEFPAAKDNLVKHLEQIKYIQRIEIAKGITLGKLADFAEEKHEEFARAAGREIDSRKLDSLRVGAEYWSRVEQITTSASELKSKGF